MPNATEADVAALTTRYNAWSQGSVPTSDLDVGPHAHEDPMAEMSEEGEAEAEDLGIDIESFPLAEGEVAEFGVDDTPLPVPSKEPNVLEVIKETVALEKKLEDVVANESNAELGDTPWLKDDAVAAIIAPDALENHPVFDQILDFGNKSLDDFAPHIIDFVQAYQKKAGYTTSKQIKTTRWHNQMNHECAQVRKAFGHDELRKTSKIRGFAAAQAERLQFKAKLKSSIPDLNVDALQEISVVRPRSELRLANNESAEECPQVLITETGISPLSRAESCNRVCDDGRQTMTTTDDQR